MPVSEVQLLDLFEKSSCENSLEVVHRGNCDFIYVPINDNFQFTDLCCCEGLGGNLWIKVSEFIKSFDREKMLYELKKRVQNNTIVYSFLRRPVLLHDENHRYLQDGDFFKEDDIILWSLDHVKKTSPMLGLKYNDSKFYGVGYRKVIRRIRLLK